jgi:hypothetical protein
MAKVPLATSLGGGEITVRLHENEHDKARGLNRTENVRPIPQSDPEFAASTPGATTPSRSTRH